MHVVDSTLARERAVAPKPSARRRRAAPAPQETARDIPGFPSWARLARAEDGATAFFAGAGLALVDRVLREGAGGGEAAFAGALRQRLALRAAESCAALSRLREDAAALRDAEHLAMGAAEPGPAGRLHRLFRLFAAHPARLDATSLARAAALLGLRAIDAEACAETLRESVAAAPDPIVAAARAAAGARAAGGASPTAEAEIFALWVADAALAIRLGWERPAPLLAVVIGHPSLRRGSKRPRPLDEDWPAAVACAYGLAAAEAHALAVDLARRSDRLAAVAPKLRARGAARVVAMLLCDDAVTPAAAARAGMSDRAARRLFDRLVALGAARELTGRETFRIYGL